MMTDQKQLENVEYINHLRSMITNEATCTHEIKSRITMAKAAFNGRGGGGCFHQYTGIKFKKKTNEVPHLKHIIKSER
jgi:hypothetical protein